MCVKSVFVVLAVIVVGLSYFHHILTKVPQLPQLEETWWGYGDPGKEDKTIKPFKINISDEMLQDLQKRLSSVRKLTPPLEGIQQQYGMNTDLLKTIVEFWKTKYHWRQREQFLNQYPQYTVSVQGLKIHYLHIKPAETRGYRVLPLLILHGWPGSIREFYDLIPLLTKPRDGHDFIFELIVPSLPGFGFSDPAVRPGMGAVEMAVVFKNLMKRLGFEKFYVQGGDWGSIIVQNVALFYPEHVLGMHSNMCHFMNTWTTSKILMYSLYPSLIVDEKFEKKMYPLGEKYSSMLLETGYFHIQATKPDTIGVALTDSPAGLAAYILEKFTTGTNKEWRNLQDGGLTKKFSYTDLLDNVMIYWVTGSMTTAMRIYSEAFNKNHSLTVLDRIPIKVPSACARFPNEISYLPDPLLKDRFTNLVHSSDFDDGGHFAAFENPELLANDIYVAVEKFIKFTKQNKRTEL